MIEQAEEKTIRKYLLGDLTEQEQTQVEERLMAEDEYFKLLEVLEDELIDESVGGELSVEDQRLFDAHFLSTPERREKLRFARSLQEYVLRNKREKADTATNESAAAQEAAAKEATAQESPLPESRDAKIYRPARWNRILSTPYLSIAAAAAVVVSLGLVIWFITRPPSDVDKGLAALRSAYQQQRPTETRITGFDYAPPPPVTRGREQEIVDPLSRDRAERILLDEVATRPNARSHHALGLLYLAKHELDKAIDQLEQALKLEERNAQIESDLGAALMEKGKADGLKEDGGKSLEDFALALEHLTKAIDLDGSLLEALFNRALCRQEMKLFAQAEEDWQSYLAKDPNSKWADEARQNLQRLEEKKQSKAQTKEQIIQEFLEAFRARDGDRAWKVASANKEPLSGKAVSEQLLGAYTDASMKGNSEDAGNALEALVYLGALEDQRSGDNFISGLAQYLRSLPPKQIELIGQARKLMAEGKGLYLQARNDQAIESYGKAKQIFEQAGDEREALLADYWIAYAYPDKADIQHSLAMFERLERAFAGRNFKWLLMRAEMSLSVAYFSLNEYSRAINFANQSLALAKQINDPNGALNAWSCLIEYYRFVGSYGQSLDCVQRSLPFIDPGSLGIVQIWRHYAIIASAFNSAGLYSAAIDCQKEALRLAQRTDNPATLCASYAHLGLMQGKAGNFDEAIKNAQLAHETARLCPDEAVGKNQMAYAALQIGNLYRQMGDYSKALDSYDESADIYKSLQFSIFLYQVCKGKLVCYIAQRNDALASQELQTTLGMVEQYRSTILEGENRNNFFDIEQSVYDLAADFEYSRMKNPQMAFQYSEESRARSLLDSLNTKTEVSTKGHTPDVSFESVSQPLSLDAAQQRMPADSQILQYAALPDKILIWVLSKTDFSSAELIIDQSELEEKVSRYMAEISGARQADAEDVSRRAKDLFDILISRVEPSLDRKKLLCIVPDKILNSLSFASLISTKSNEYLIKDYTITYSLSSSVFVFCSEEAKRKEGARIERALSVGNPRFDSRIFASLPDLPSAGAEAKEVAACYGLSRCLIGDEARKSIVESELSKSEVAHFALHSVLDENSPMRSKLVLAKEPGGASGGDDFNGALESYEVYKLKLPRTRLVALSACQTGSDRYYKGEGMYSMARSFLVAGVPLTVASLWAVDSDSTKVLMVRFHKYRKGGAGLPSAEALKRAQLDMLNDSESEHRKPYHWASFIAIGGQTSF